MRRWQTPWRVWVDTGGTFTDCLAVSPGGSLRRAKVLSSGRIRARVRHRPTDRKVTLDVSWDLPEGFFRCGELSVLSDPTSKSTITDFQRQGQVVELAAPLGKELAAGTGIEISGGVEAPVLAAHWVTRTPLSESLPPISLRLATTRGTNALLERRGARTALFITEGFGDLLEIGNQQRPDLFALQVEKSPPLYEAVVEVHQRMNPLGEILKTLDLEALSSKANRLLDEGIEVAAVALLHSFRNPRHEAEVAGFLASLGFRHVSQSAALAPLIKIVPRAETAVVNAYLSEIIGQYLHEVGRSIDPGPVHVLTSAGSLVSHHSYLPKDSLLSGPAGGVVGAGAMAQLSGWSRSLAFDMGGTSTDVSRFDGEPDYRFETRVGDVRLLSPSLAIETVAAGGGSICHFDGRQLKVGPQSAGANPGPACYGAGGPLTLTDVNLLLGRLRPESFEIPIDPTAAEKGAEELLRDVRRQDRRGMESEVLLQGFLEIANERMAAAVRRISIRQGYRPREFALVAFGGAGGQHACALAETLEMETVLVPEDAGLLSAVGLGRARVERFAEQQVLQTLDEVLAELESMLGALADRARRQVVEEGIAEEDVHILRREVSLRLVGQEAALGVSWQAGEALRKSFEVAYEDHYGYPTAGAAIEVESLRVMAGSTEVRVERVAGTPAPTVATTSESRPVFLDGEWQSVPVFDRSSLHPGAGFIGPALVFESHCATVVHPGWHGWIDGARCLVVQTLDAGRHQEPGR